MSQKYTAEEVRAVAVRLHDDITVKDGDALAASDMLTAYADLIELAQAGVTGEVVERAYAAMDATFRREYPAQLDEAEKSLALEGVRAALLAVWPVAAEPAQAAQVDSASWFDGLYENPDATGIDCYLHRADYDSMPASVPEEWITNLDSIPQPIIQACRNAICREFGNNGTDGYYKRILAAIFKAIAGAPSAPEVGA